MLKALIFDFDGLILDTETPELFTWQKIYRDHGVELMTREWVQIVGGSAMIQFEPAEKLSELVGRSLDLKAIKTLARESSMKIILAQPILPGALELIKSAKKHSLKIAVASSSPHHWVDGHLKRLGIINQFDTVLCAEDVPHTKPFPDLFIASLEKLNVNSNETIVFEDSLNGVLAANSAGIFCVAVPNQVTKTLDLSQADLQLESLEQVSLDDLKSRFIP
ncbi:HAD family hydrolase [Chloroflexota bacterium]